MARAAKDVLATALVGVVVLTLLATWRGWDVALVGGSRRWAAGVVLLLGSLACGLGEPTRSRVATMLALLGAFALLDGVVAVVTGSLVALVLLVVDVVLLWAAATLGHFQHHGSPRTIAA
jgi:hypothetical protein